MGVRFRFTNIARVPIIYIYIARNKVIRKQALYLPYNRVLLRQPYNYTILT